MMDDLVAERTHMPSSLHEKSRRTSLLIIAWYMLVSGAVVANMYTPEKKNSPFSTRRMITRQMLLELYLYERSFCGYRTWPRVTLV